MKHGGRGRRGWRKLHLGVDQSGVIRVHTLTEETGDDATTGLDLLNVVEGPLVCVTADAAYDTVAVYETARAAGCDGRRPTGQDGEHIWPRPAVARAGSDDHVGEADRPAPLEESVRYHRQGRVENTFFRYKSIIGDGFAPGAQPGRGVRLSSAVRS